MDPDRIVGAAEQAQGRAEVATGRLTGDTGLRIEGHGDEAAGAVRHSAGTVREATQEAGDDSRSEIVRLRAEVERLAAEPATPRLDAVARTAERYDRQLDRYLDSIRKRPLAALGVATFAGFLVGRFLGGNSIIYRI